MRYFLSLFLLLLGASPILSQQKPQAPASKDDPPILSADKRADIAILERNLLQEQEEQLQLQQQYRELSNKMHSDNEELQKDLAAANLPGWTLDPISLTYKKSPTPPKASSPPKGGASKNSTPKERK